MSCVKDSAGRWVESPVHGAFGLSYASYLVWPRVLMEDMPLDWQQRLVALADEFNATWESYEPKGGYSVTPNMKGAKDPLANYRHPDFAFIERLRRQPAPAESTAPPPQ